MACYQVLRFHYYYLFFISFRFIIINIIIIILLYIYCLLKCLFIFLKFVCMSFSWYVWMFICGGLITDWRFIFWHKNSWRFVNNLYVLSTQKIVYEKYYYNLLLLWEFLFFVFLQMKRKKKYLKIYISIK